MDKTKKRFIFFIIAAIMCLALVGCGTIRVIFSAVTIRSDHNLSSIRLGGTLRFSASVQVTWIVSSTSDGSGAVSEGTFITQNGVLTVSIHETITVIYVIAISTDGERSDVKQVRVVNVNAVTVTPANQTAVAGRNAQFRAEVTGTNNPDNVVTWTVSSNAAGTGAVISGTSINANGQLTVAPNESIQTLYVRATSVVDPSVSGNVPVRVVVPTVTGVSVSPMNQAVTSGQTLQFSATVTGTYEPDPRVTWRVSSNAAGSGAVTQGTSISATGLLTVAPNETLSTLFVIATSVFDQSRSGSVQVGVIIPIVTGVVVSPANASIPAGSSLQFTASVTGTNNPSTAVTWRVSTNAAGTGAVTQGTSIDANGILTVSPNETARTLYIFATSVANTARSGSVPVNISAAAPPPPEPPPPPVVTPPNVTAVTVNPSTITTTPSSTVQFSATVTGTNNPSTAVTWRVSSNAAGTGAVTAGTNINSGGLLTIAAGETSGTLYVFATSTANTSISGSATVTVNVPATPPPPPPVSPPTITAPTVTSVTVNPIATTTPTNRTVQFSAMVMGANNPSTTVTWSVSRNADGTGAVTSGTSINANGLLTVAANESATILYVRATSTVNTSIFGLSAVTISSN